jgi:alpha/beta superfamily hydrolase
MDSLEVVESFLPKGYSVFCFDFSGAGNSEGEYISLGYYESSDIRTVV